jgi:hypothetical protein
MYVPLRILECHLGRDFCFSVQNSRWLLVVAGGAAPMVSNSQEKATTPQTTEREFWTAKKSMPVV